MTDFTPALSFVLPEQTTLLAELDSLAVRSDAVARGLAAIKSGFFTHPDGRTDELGDVSLFHSQLALLAHLAHIAPQGLSIEIGFGMGSSTAIILGVRALEGPDFQHLAFDPYGLPDNRGTIVQNYLETEFGDAFKRIYKRSEIGLAQLFDNAGAGSVGLIFIDGSHTFENVIVDFFWADALCCVGGYIIFDDADYPAIETAINYIEKNRPNYQIHRSAAVNTTILFKTADYEIPWYAFAPFEVAERKDWDKTPA